MDKERTISQQIEDVKEDMMKMLAENVKSDEEDIYIKVSAVVQLLRELSSVNPQPCEDAISRQAVIDSLHSKFADGFDSDRWWNSKSVLYAINKVPPVNPTKTGHWIEKDGFDGDTYYDCSECGESWTTIVGTPWDNGMKYCPNCGCRMVKPQESEE